MTVSIREQCKLILSGNREDSPAQMFSAMGRWCEAHAIKHDIYGEGDLIQRFEQKIAKLLGYEAGLFVVTGTMAQPTVLQMIGDEKNNPLVAMHETCHIFRHENQGYQLQNRFNVLPVGNVFNTWKASDLKKLPDKVAAAVYELPMREIGGQLPRWEDLEEIKHYCAVNNIHLHMDGARLWECAAFYQKSYQQIADGFETAYVSLYKGVNGLGGALLLGKQKLITQAAAWMHRQGGSVYHRTPYVVAAAMQFDQRIALMPALFKRTQEIYSLLKQYPHFITNPAAPQVNMLHLYLPLDHADALELRDKLAREQSVWLGNPQPTALTNQVKVEWYIGDTLLDLTDDRLVEIFDWISAKVQV